MNPAEVTGARTGPLEAPAPTVIKRSELPLSCPLPEDPVWNQHPKVYLPIEKEGRAKCPYCGAAFVLED